MNIGYQWLARYLTNPPPVGEVQSALIHAGFPVESCTQVGQDWRLDVEITSNRGDCLSHLGLAREVAAQIGQPLRSPATPPAPAGDEPVERALRLENHAPQACPLFTARVVRGVRVGPSPGWLREALESVGQRSINNVVDVTNFICLELGNPCHVFDLSRLRGGALDVRWARAGETLTTLDGKARRLAADDLVVADDAGPQSLAGVMGGADSEVSPGTTDVVFEMATWDPVVVRRAARRHGLRTDASYRFERVVEPRTLAGAADRAVALLAQIAGGRVSRGVLQAGRPLPAPVRVRFRPARCRQLLGIDIPTEEMVALLARVEVECAPVGRGGDEIACTPPAFRPDLTREADLIEEVGRIKGLGAIPVHERLEVRVRPPQPSELARREIAATLTGLGFYEAVTFSFASPAAASAFLPAGLETIGVDDDRRGDEPILRPSVLPGLLACRRKNQHALVHEPGGVRLYEIAAAFAQQQGRAVEHLNLALLLDVACKSRTPAVAELQQGVRLIRGAVEALARAMAGPDAPPRIEPAEPHAPGFDPGAFARLWRGGTPLGYFGLLTKECLASFDLASPVAVAELDLAALTAGYPPVPAVTPLPAFPGIERDVSLIVPEQTRWSQIEREVLAAAAPPLVGVSFVTTYRGAQTGKGRKSVTFRLAFRDPSRTLRHEEIDAPVHRLIEGLRATFDAAVRA